MNKQTHLHLGWPEGEYIFSLFKLIRCYLFLCNHKFTSNLLMKIVLLHQFFLTIILSECVLICLETYIGCVPNSSESPCCLLSTSWILICNDLITLFMTSSSGNSHSRTRQLTLLTRSVWEIQHSCCLRLLRGTS